VKNLTSSLSGTVDAPSSRKSVWVALHTTAKRLIPRCFDHDRPHNCVSYLAVQHKPQGRKNKDFTGELFDPQYLTSQGGVRPVSKGEPNGLESTKNRRSAGRHGNQHVYVRDPQVSGSRIYTSHAGGPPGLTRSR
jgi:hypothetical protein